MESSVSIPSRRIIRIASGLADTPVELIEPILADLPLHRVLDLLATRYGLRERPYPGYRNGTSLGAAIRGSVAWPMLRQADLSRLRSLWTAFNQLSLLSEGLFLASSVCKPAYIDRLCANFNMTGKELQQSLEDDLKTAFFDRVVIQVRFKGKGTTLTALSKYLTATAKELSCFSFSHTKTVSVRSMAAKWTVDDCIGILPNLLEAQRHLDEEKATELRYLADMYERYPTYLKTAGAPQSPRQDLQHIPQQLKYHARRPDRLKYAFRYAHSILVPYDWCFRLFDAVAGQAQHKDVDHVVDWQKATDGMRGLFAPEANRPLHRLTSSRRQVIRRQDDIAPTPAEELCWLESFMCAIRWIETEFPALAADLKAASTVPGTPRAGVLLEPADFDDFIHNARAEDVATQLRADLEVSKQEGAPQLPSLVALYMPPFSSPRARKIARHLWPGVRGHFGVQELLYDQMIKAIKTTLAQVPGTDAHDDGQDEVQRHMPTLHTTAADRKRTCYICHMVLDTPHKTLPSMTALVTGGRTNLGFHTALRLLRCGAFVVASSRYPEDALSRYRAEFGFDAWSDRLRIVGADFRTARDAFALVEATRGILAREGRTLDILINNAAQTLTDPVEREKEAIAREQMLLLLLPPLEAPADGGGPGGERVVVRQGYAARVRGGATGVVRGVDGGDAGCLTADSSADDEPPSLDAPMSNLQVSSPPAPSPSSWVQSLSDIPYEDVVTAHSVNTFVPLILVRELLPLMRHGGGGGRGCSGHIVNVSSREGLFERRRDGAAKNGKHVHTNMSKAGLNMITETEAAGAWRRGRGRVAMNTVDPGYMSAAPEMEASRGGERPIGWEDGAGRVLWPIAKAERGEVVWGRFLKHYGAVRVDTRRGRG
ncbi:hypothetical protein CSHISOI_04605 [Colletotrichum shisoi]|uniref:Oxidoreductase n=1 Tax=Colletotrichum shisoi TaxID=2078593 RepID=A0A5Q4BUV5_9PEZI|nr:hypothetical protein CSHISOI_04605 [Colletotrichum shisoi]